jgi:hypothetical protein
LHTCKQHTSVVGRSRWEQAIVLNVNHHILCQGFPLEYCPMLLRSQNFTAPAELEIRSGAWASSVSDDHRTHQTLLTPSAGISNQPRLPPFPQLPSLKVLPSSTARGRASLAQRPAATAPSLQTVESQRCCCPAYCRSGLGGTVC